MGGWSLPERMGSPHSIKRYIKFDLYKRTLDLEPSSNIEGEAEVYLNVGSSHSIRCLVNSPQPPHHIFWYFQHQVNSKSMSFICASQYGSKFSKIQIEHTNSPQPLSFDQDWSEEHKLGENTSSSTISVRRWSFYKNRTNLCFVDIDIIISH